MCILKYSVVSFGILSILVGTSFAAPASVPSDIITNVIDGEQTYGGDTYLCKVEIKDNAGNLLARMARSVNDHTEFAGNPVGNGAALYLVEGENSGIVIGYDIYVGKDHLWSKNLIHANAYIYRRTGTDQDPDGRGILNHVLEGLPAEKSATGEDRFYAEIVESKDTLLGQMSLEGVGSKTQPIDQYSVSTSCDALNK